MIKHLKRIYRKNGERNEEKRREKLTKTVKN